MRRSIEEGGRAVNIIKIVIFAASLAKKLF